MTQPMTASAAAQNTVTRIMAAVAAIFRFAEDSAALAPVRAAITGMGRAFLKAKVPKVARKATDDLVNAAHRVARAANLDNATPAAYAGFRAHLDAIQMAAGPYIDAQETVNRAEDAHGHDSQEAKDARAARAAAGAAYEAAWAGIVEGQQ